MSTHNLSELGERAEFEAWMADRGTQLVIEHPQAFDAWCASAARFRSVAAVTVRSVDWATGTIHCRELEFRVADGMPDRAGGRFRLVRVED